MYESEKRLSISGVTKPNREKDKKLKDKKKLLTTYEDTPELLSNLNYYDYLFYLFCLYRKKIVLSIYFYIFNSALIHIQGGEY